MTDAERLTAARWAEIVGLRAEVERLRGVVELLRGELLIVASAPIVPEGTRQEIVGVLDEATALEAKP